MLFDKLNFLCMNGSPEDYEPVACTEICLDNRVFNEGFRASREYTRALQLAFMDAMSEIDRLQHVINQSAHASIMNDAEQIRQDYYRSLRTIAELEAETEKQSLLLDFYKKAAEDSQIKLSVRDLMKLEQSGKTRDSSGVIRSIDGIPGEDKKIKAACYSVRGWSNEDIAREIGVSRAETVRQYVSGMKKHFNVSTVTAEVDGREQVIKSIVFDEEYKSISIDLSSIPSPPARMSYAV